MTGFTSSRSEMADLCVITHDERRYPRQGEVEHRCALVAARQLGLITRAQLLGEGLTERAIDYRLAAAQLTACFPGVYRYPGAPVSWHQKLLAVCLWRDAVVSHRSAAALWRLAGFEAGLVECVTSKSIHRMSGVILHRGTLGPGERGRLGPVPVTSPNRTLVDLAAVATFEDLEMALDDALNRRVTTLAKLHTRVAAMETRGRKGLTKLRSLLRELDDSPRVPTKFERLLAHVLGVEGLPKARREFEVVDGRRAVARVDFAYPEHKVAVEADSYKWHSSPQALQRDRHRSNALTQLGWRLHRATWWDATERPHEIQVAVANLLGVQRLRLA